MSISRQFTKYVSQNILGTLGVSCYIIVDTFFIAQAAGTNGITVLNLALPVYSVIFAIGAMIGVGSATRFAILRAQKDKRADEYFSNALIWIALFSAVFVVLGLLAPDKVMRAMGADREILKLGLSYFRIFLLFTPFFMMNYVFTAFVRNDNAPSLAMVATITSSLSNVIFDYIFMFPMKMGLAGAALATAASPIISILICSIHFRQKENTIQFIFRRPSLLQLGLSCQLGVPAFISEFSSGVTIMVFNFLILSIAGNIGVAAYGVVANFAQVALAIFNGVAQGSQPLISKFYGKGDKASVQKLLKLGVCTALVIALLEYGIVLLFTEELVALFNSEQSVELAAYAFRGMRLYFVGFIFAGFNIVGAGYLSATEHAAGAFTASVMRGVVAIIVFAYALTALFGFTGVWLSFTAAEAVTAWITAAALAFSHKKVGFVVKNIE